MPILYLDIEVESSAGFPEPAEASNEVISIACYTTHDKKMTVFGFDELSGNPDYVKCDDEKDLLHRFWSMLGVDISMIVGWNSAGFDIPYLINRSKNIGLEVEKYMPLGQVRESFNKDTNQTEYNIPGVILYDYMNLYKKFKLEKLEKYSLEFVCQYEMGEGKVAYTVDHNSLQELYENDFKTFIEYNMKDVMLIVDLDKKMNFINLGLQLAYISKANPQDISSAMKLWDAIIYNNLKSQKIAVPRKLNHDLERYEGAFVAEPVTGKWEWVVSFDYGSLYPNEMISWNMSPQSIVPFESLPQEVKELRSKLKVTANNPSGAVDQLINGELDLSVLKKHNLSMSGRGDFFDISKQDIVCKVLEDTYQKRVDTKKQSTLIKKQLNGSNDETDELDNVVQALKILMNSYYGLCGNRYFRYYNRDVAESVTITGQMLIKNQMKMLDELFLEKTGKTCVKYGDTDSVYFSMNPMLEQYGKAKTIEEKLSFINKGITKLIAPRIEENDAKIMNSLNVFKQTLFMNREAISQSAIFLEKKKYACYVKDDEGFVLDEPKIKVKGFEIVRTSTPQVIRDKLKATLKYILDGATESELKKYVDDFRKEFNTYNPLDIAFPRGCSAIKKWVVKEGYAPGTPIHVRSAILYNNRIKKLGLDNRYPTVHSGGKIKFIYLKMPNPMKENVIGVPNVGIPFPPEFGLDEYYDYKIMFEKAYIAPLKTILDRIGYEIGKKKAVELF